MRIKILFFINLLILCSCNTFRFAKEGIFVDDVDKYFNPKQDIDVWVYANFYPYKGLDRGLRMDGLYAQDKAVLRSIDLKGSHSKVLFASIPESAPYYQLIAIQHTKPLKDLHGFEKITVDSSYYYQKDAKLERLDVRQVYIPYGGDKALTLVYYISTEKHYNCPFCKLDYLAQVNANALQHRQNAGLSWQIFNCEEGKKVKTIINLKNEVFAKYKTSYLKLYADYGHTRGIQYFQVLNPQSKPELHLDLCPERYILELTDHKQKLVYSDTLVVE